MNLDWKALLTTYAPIVLAAFPAIAPLAPFVILGISEAKKLEGASNAEKLAHAATIAQAGIEGTNALAVAKTGQPVIDPALSKEALAAGISAVYDVVKIIHQAKATTPQLAAAPAA